MGCWVLCEGNLGWIAWVLYGETGGKLGDVGLLDLCREDLFGDVIKVFLGRIYE